MYLHLLTQLVWLQSKRANQDNFNLPNSKVGSFNQTKSDFSSDDFNK